MKGDLANAAEHGEQGRQSPSVAGRPRVPCSPNGLTLETEARLQRMQRVDQRVVGEDQIVDVVALNGHV